MVSTSIASAGLADTLARIDAETAWLAVRPGVPPDPSGWTVLADVDEAYVRAWEQDTARRHREEYGRADRVTAAGYVLSWCAGVPGKVGGACFALARRVPRLEPEALALHRHPVEVRLDGVALLDERFWCLPDDPAADASTATVVADEAALATVLRAQVRAHADRFLAWYTPGARLPRRSPLGAFVDGLDTGLWMGARYARRPAPLRSAAVVLPGGTAEFREASTLYTLRDERGRDHLTRERIACCHHYRLDAARQACFTCPRTDLAERRRRATEWDDDAP